MDGSWKKINVSLNKNTENGTSTDMLVITGYHVFIGIVFVLISLIGIIGNSLVLVVVKKKTAMRTTTNFLLANLATADLVSLLGLLPKVFHSFVNHRDPDRVVQYICMFLTAGNLSVIALGVSIITLAILAFERYMALLKPMREKWRLNKENVKYAIIGSWMLSIGITFPYFLRTTYSQTHKGCVHIWASHTEQLIYLTTIFIFVFIMPYLMIIFGYFSIIKGIYFSNQICPMDTGNTEADARSKKRVVEVLLIVTLSFSTCVGTFALVNMLKELGIVDGNSVVFHLASALLFANSSINPIIYAFRSSNYKTAFREIIKGSISVQA
ncbi:allatostatin-A receptor-like [Actinia tenebrosa]|uniref:Allatostatin-A receptor-like n=1 Tax=Actinia tenebrosa TaxID=6105 RepID=A0A6P8I1J0_ACTTE|nr:allatostatin-A receptor-like [Actinia tenebrosa]